MNTRETADTIMEYYELVGAMFVIMLLVALDSLRKRFEA